MRRENLLAAHARVVRNAGDPGVDGMTLDDLMAYCRAHWARIREQLLNGTYVPQPVRRVEIPKLGGTGMRTLGIPTVADRVAQTVVKMALEPVVDSHFHPDSYGYRPGKSALDAVGVAGKLYRGLDWVIDLNIKAAFDSIPHDLVELAVAHHTDIPWVQLYMKVMPYKLVGLRLLTVPTKLRFQFPDVRLALGSLFLMILLAVGWIRAERRARTRR